MFTVKTMLVDNLWIRRRFWTKSILSVDDITKSFGKEGEVYPAPLGTSKWGNFVTLVFFKLGFTPCTRRHEIARHGEQPLQGIELQEKEDQNDKKHTRKLLKKNLQIKSVCQL